MVANEEQKHFALEASLQHAGSMAGTVEYVFAWDACVCLGAGDAREELITDKSLFAQA